MCMDWYCLSMGQNQYVEFKVQNLEATSVCRAQTWNYKYDHRESYPKDNCLNICIDGTGLLQSNTRQKYVLCVRYTWPDDNIKFYDHGWVTGPILCQTPSTVLGVVDIDYTTSQQIKPSALLYTKTLWFLLSLNSDSKIEGMSHHTYFLFFLLSQCMVKRI